MRKCANISSHMRIEQAVNHIWLCNCSILNFLYMREIWFSFLSVRGYATFQGCVPCSLCTMKGHGMYNFFYFVISISFFSAGLVMISLIAHRLNNYIECCNTLHLTGFVINCPFKGEFFLKHVLYSTRYNCVYSICAPSWAAKSGDVWWISWTVKSKQPKRDRSACPSV